MDAGYFFEGGEIRFVAAFPGAREVGLAASFTGWRPLPLSRRLDGRFERAVPAPAPGLHQYKLVVDGAWREDPAHQDRRPDGYGGRNSTLLVGAPGLTLGGMGALRLASLNLHTYQEPEPLAKLAEIARVFAALDIHAAALQEVAQHRHEPLRHPNAGEVLRRRLEEETGAPWYHEWRFAHVGFDVYDEGVSLLSRAPLEAAAEHALGGRTYRRVAVSAALSGAPLRLCSAHTSWPADGGAAEVSALLAALGAGPALVAGDFNASDDAAQIRALTAAGFIDVGRELDRRANTFFGGHGPEEARIDYHFLRPGGSGFRPLGFTPLFDGAPVLGVAQPRVSDHAGLLGAYTRG